MSPPSADAVESSVTLRLRHHACDHSLWEHLDRRARAEAETFCSARGGLDEDTMRWVRHDSPYGSDKICVVHLHYGCVGQLPGDLTR